MKRPIKLMTVNPGQITEVGGEVTLVKDGNPVYKRLVAIVTIVKGNAHVRYGVYHGSVCVMCSSSLSLACDRYNACTIRHIPSNMAGSVEEMVSA